MSSARRAPRTSVRCSDPELSPLSWTHTPVAHHHPGGARGGGVLSAPHSLLVCGAICSFVHSFIIGTPFPLCGAPQLSCLPHLPVSPRPIHAPFPPLPPSGPIGADRPGGTESGAGPRFPSTHGGAPVSGNAPRGCWALRSTGGSVALPATPGRSGRASSLLPRAAPCRRRARVSVLTAGGCAGRVMVRAAGRTCESE